MVLLVLYDCGECLDEASGVFTNAWASARGLWSTMPMSISPPSFLMRAGLPSASARGLPLLYSHKGFIPLLNGSLRYSRGPFLAAMFLLVFGSCFGSHDEAGLLAFEALQGLPRPARGTHGSLKVAPHVLVKPWFAAPPPCTFHCSVRKVKKMPIEDIHLALAPNQEFYLVPVRLLVQFRLQAVGGLLR